jgi:hypothetical protein
MVVVLQLLQQGLVIMTECQIRPQFLCLATTIVSHIRPHIVNYHLYLRC